MAPLMVCLLGERASTKALPTLSVNQALENAEAEVA